MPSKDKAKQAKWQNNFYKRNKAYYTACRDARRQLVYETVTQIKAMLGCFICGENEPCALDFHHLDPKDKESDITLLSRRGRS